MLHIMNIRHIFSDNLYNKLRAYLQSGHVIECDENDTGCYDALLREDGMDFWVEATLDDNGYLEDCYCAKCNSIDCFHTAAVIALISQMQGTSSQHH